MKLINNTIGPPIRDDHMDMDANDDDPDAIQRGAPVLHPIGSQFYNALSHRVRNQAKFHAVQLGLVTSAFAGAAVKSPVGIRHWQRCLNACENALPHQTFAHKVSGDGQPQALRLENTYTLDVHRMLPRHRNGV